MSSDAEKRNFDAMLFQLLCLASAVEDKKWLLQRVTELQRALQNSVSDNHANENLLQTEAQGSPSKSRPPSFSRSQELECVEELVAENNLELEYQPRELTGPRWADVNVEEKIENMSGIF